MARKRVIEAADDGGMILPLRLVRKDVRRDEFLSQSRERSQWFRDRGIDPADWSAVYPVLKASWRVHGMPSAADRVRLRAADAGTGQ